MKKEELVRILSEKTGFSRRKAQETVDALMEALIEGISRDGRLVLAGFGTFEVVERKGRRGVNPRTAKTIEIPPKKVVKFKSGKHLRDAVEGK